MRQRRHAAMHAGDHALLLSHLLYVAHWVRVIEWNVVVVIFPPEISPATSFRRRWPPGGCVCVTCGVPGPTVSRSRRAWVHCTGCTQHF
jgi:hypothetical protein